MIKDKNTEPVNSEPHQQTGHTPNPKYLPENSIQPTPIPWRILRTPQGFKILSQPIGQNQQGIEIAQTYLAGLEDKKNGEFIVRAVNSHSALLEAAKAALIRLNYLLDDATGTLSPTYFQVEAAIKQAEQEQI